MYRDIVHSSKHIHAERLSVLSRSARPGSGSVRRWFGARLVNVGTWLQTTPHMTQQTAARA